MSEMEPSASDIFNKMAEEAVRKTPANRFIEFSNHPDDEGYVQKIMEILSQTGVEEIWKPITYGIVINVENYSLDEETRRILRTDVQNEQVIDWITQSGYRMRFCWDNLKPFRVDVDYSKFPDGFKKNDIIRVTQNGAFIVRVEPVSLEELRKELFPDSE